MTRKNTILVADDNEDLRKLVRFSLARKGYRVLQAKNGREGLELTKKERPDLIISDIMMPEIDGLEFCREVKSSEELSDTFFILLTGKLSEDRRIDGIVEGLELGADDFLTKPFDIRELTARVEAGLRLTNLQDDLKEALLRLREAQGQLLRTSKMKAVAQLALGIAHEFGNIIAGISGMAQVAARKKDETVLGKLFKVIDENSNRAMEIVNSLLSFARADEMKVEEFPLARVLDGAFLLIENSLAKQDITVERNYTDTASVQGSLSALQQVFLNLFINARDAMTRGGRLTVQVRENGGRVFVDVADTGVGIPEDHLNRIFEPFFTTKGSLGGGQIGCEPAGLGLPVSYEIIKRHDGTINVESTIGEGSTFSIVLPKKRKVQALEERPT